MDRAWRPGELGLADAPPGGQPRSGLAPVPAAFRERAARHPEALAVLGEAGSLSYGALDRRSDLLAAALREAGLRPGDAVPVCLPRDTDLVVAWLAVLKAGGGLLPMDVSWPAERQSRVLAQCGAAVAVAAPDPGWPGVRILGPDARGGAPGDGGPATGGPDGLAYLIHTSGSSGVPKCVAVAHGPLAFTLDRVARAYGLGPGDRVLQLGALGFDTALEQVLAPLTAGAAVVLGGADTWAPTELLDRIGELHLTVADLTPAYWHHLLAQVPPGGLGHAGLRLVVVGGDVVHVDDCRTFLERLPDVRLLNAYGVSEAAITSTLCEVTAELLGDAAALAPAPIGRPLPGVRVHLLDPLLRPVPPGGKGEIHLAGPGLALGYWRDAAATAEAFVPDPFAAEPGGRMYRTGDAGRLRPDGVLEILGRLDEQVKVGGFRVDPTEVEAVLTGHPDVRLAKVVADRTAPDGSVALTAYYTTADPAASRAPGRIGLIRAHLARHLPAFMVPAAFVPLATMPLTAAGKIDRRALPRHPAPHGGSPAAPPTPGPDGGVPTDATELTVGRLWAELLGVDHVEPLDDFFALGGTSLLAMEMLARVRLLADIDVTRVRGLTRALLGDPTLRAFAAAVRGARGGAEPGGGAPDWVRETEVRYPVRHGGGSAPDRTEPAELLLTGATGFCGAHLLETLLATTRARIHCLVRAPGDAAAAERLHAAQERFLGHRLDDPRIVPLIGDLTEPLLGLPRHRFDRLAEHLDGIHHLGAQVNFLYPYHQLRRANVDGTREVVRLAGHRRAVPVHYVSTLAVLAGFGPAGVREVDERTPSPTRNTSASATWRPSGSPSSCCTGPPPKDCR
ncbi:amino acid adenylation domain-containing protein [Streptomyces sp. TLI_171]|uniref:non-ribosomal peptide synthetase n=1 Tax=Streptomyces sp. TLI_171 TaxID=1938859 RepID=UPI00217F17A8|nr:amino acid adenylation domain-containing protein [Streptomyces sp. TLI_171]